MNLQQIAPIVQDAIQKALKEKRYRFGFAKRQGLSDKIASGKLYNSVQVISKKDGNDDYTLQVLMEDYSQWVQSGRLPGKRGVPIEAIEEWIRERKLQGRDKKGRYIKRRSFAFAIQTNIKKFGIRPSNFLDVALENIMDDDRIIQFLEDASFEDLIDTIEGI